MAENTTVAVTPVDRGSIPIEHRGALERYEFVHENLWTSVPVIVIVALASIIGTFGNCLILVSVIYKPALRRMREFIFIVNLAIADLGVTLIADPMSLIAKIEGEHFFDSVPGLCPTIARLCTISCVTSLMTIAMMSLNRYFYICRQDWYVKIFTKRNCIIICVSLYTVGIFLVLLNFGGVGDHSFDRKSLECIWDRMATFPYTVVFSVVLVWIPCVVIGLCYLHIYLYVRKRRRRVETNTQGGSNEGSGHRKLHLAKTLFIIYSVFAICWIPYALLIVVDSDDTFAHEIHVYVTMFAHLHPSINWLVYYLTNKKFAAAYKDLLGCLVCKVRVAAGSGKRQRSAMNGTANQNKLKIVVTEEEFTPTSTDQTSSTNLASSSNYLTVNDKHGFQEFSSELSSVQEENVDVTKV